MSDKSPSIDETFKSLERLKELQEGKKPKKKKPKAKKPKPLVEAQGGGKVKYRRIGGKVLNGNDITKMIYG